jgi:hypothetical protein
MRARGLEPPRGCPAVWQGVAGGGGKRLACRRSLITWVIKPAWLRERVSERSGTDWALIRRHRAPTRPRPRGCRRHRAVLAHAPRRQAPGARRWRRSGYRDFAIDLAGRYAPRKAPIPQRPEINSASPMPPPRYPKIAPTTTTIVVREPMTMRSRRARSATLSP